MKALLWKIVERFLGLVAKIAGSTKLMIALPVALWLAYNGLLTFYPTLFLSAIFGFRELLKIYSDKGNLNG